MRKIFLFAFALIVTAPTYADNITDGLAISGDQIYGYSAVVQTICLVLACVIGVVGAFSVYTSFINNDANMRKKVLTWGGSCLTMLCMSFALPSFFAYEESGPGGGSTTKGGLTGKGEFAGGDTYGTIIPIIPGIDNPIWRPDDRYRPHIIIDGGPLPDQNILLAELN